MKSSENYRGTNCVACHIAPEGEVLGVIRLEFNLNHLTQMVNHRTLIGVGIMSVIALFGFMLTLFFMRRIIVLPLQKRRPLCEVSKVKIFPIDSKTIEKMNSGNWRYPSTH